MNLQGNNQSCMAADYVAANETSSFLNRFSPMTKLLLAAFVAFAAHPLLTDQNNADQTSTNQLLAFQAINGTWTADLETWDDARMEDAIYLQLQRRRSKGNYQSGNVYRRSELIGFQVAADNKGTVDSRFQIEREAGRFDFDGRFRDNVGAGTFRFEMDRSFIDKMARLGFDGLDEERIYS
ncbi:MAG: hypothetical protein HKN13_01950, partial [Rhodothermales bacterium]|nr:hypothetical protein [Rhodothermales bacterium]